MIEKLLRRVAMLLAAGVAVTLTAGIAQASAAAPIEGVWNFQDGQVRVAANADGTFTGTVVAPTTFDECVHPATDVVWQLSGAGDSYSGTHQWLNPPRQGPNSCSPAGLGDANWTITTTSNEATLTFCTAAPGSGPVAPGATPGNPVGKTLCYALSQAIAPGSEPGVPVDISAPVISGTPSIGDTLTCSTGSWSHSPTGYAYTWQRDGSPIANATRPTYTVQSADAGTTITCEVIATNGGGLGTAARSGGVQIGPLATGAPGGGSGSGSGGGSGSGSGGGSGSGSGGGSGGVPGGKNRTGCPAASGRLSGHRLGSARLGMTRSAVRHAYRGTHDRATRFRDVFCLSAHGVQVGYVTTPIDRTLGTREVRRLKGRVIWATTANTAYSVRGVRPGATLRTARRHLKLGAGRSVHHARWYFVRFRRVTVLIKTSHGRVREVGIVDPQLTRGRTGHALLRSLA